MDDYNGMSYWQRVFSGFAGGVFFSSTVLTVAEFAHPSRFVIAAFLLLFAAFSLYFGRYGFGRYGGETL